VCVKREREERSFSPTVIPHRAACEAEAGGDRGTAARRGEVRRGELRERRREKSA